MPRPLVSRRRGRHLRPNVRSGSGGTAAPGRRGSPGLRQGRSARPEQLTRSDGVAARRPPPGGGLSARRVPWPRAHPPPTSGSAPRKGQRGGRRSNTATTTAGPCALRPTDRPGCHALYRDAEDPLEANSGRRPSVALGHQPFSESQLFGTTPGPAAAVDQRDPPDDSQRGPTVGSYSRSNSRESVSRPGFTSTSRTFARHAAWGPGSPLLPPPDQRPYAAVRRSSDGYSLTRGDVRLGRKAFTAFRGALLPR